MLTDCVCVCRFFFFWCCESGSLPLHSVLSPFCVLDFLLTVAFVCRRIHTHSVQCAPPPAPQYTRPLLLFLLFVVVIGLVLFYYSVVQINLVARSSAIRCANCREGKLIVSQECRIYSTLLSIIIK